MNNDRIIELIGRFIEILDGVEDSESGHVFHPVTIYSCRVMKTKEVGEILEELRELVAPPRGGSVNAKGSTMLKLLLKPILDAFFAVVLISIILIEESTDYFKKIKTILRNPR